MSRNGLDTLDDTDISFLNMDHRSDIWDADIWDAWHITRVTP